MNAIKFSIAFALAAFVVPGFAQTISTGLSAPATTPSAQKWLEQEKFEIYFYLAGAQVPTKYAAYPKQGKIMLYNMKDFCNSNGPFPAVFSSKEGKLVVLFTRTRPGCLPVEMEFDLATLAGKLETVETSGQRNTFPNITVKLLE
jgi:hypothetical protein